MSDFLKEGARADGKKPKLPPRKPQRIQLDAPRAPKRTRKKSSRELSELLRDFRLGLTSLRALTQRLQVTRPEFKAQRGKPAPIPPAITKIVERERKIVERLLVQMPARERELVLREYEKHTQSAMQERAPQAYAAILRGAQMAPQVLRPDQPYVKELMATAKAIKSGRLPFLPKEIVTRARKLLHVLFGKQRATELLTSRDVVTRRLISQYRLIPRSVQAAVSAKPKRQMTRIERELQAVVQRGTVAKAPAATNQPISRAELAEVAASLPAMHSGGAVAGGGGSGEYRMQAGEDVHVVTRDDSMMTAPSPGQSGEAPRAGVTTSALPADGRVTPTNAAVTPGISKAPMKGESRAAKPFAEPAMRRAEFTAGGAQTETSLKVSDISGLSDWIAGAEERLNRIDG